MGRHVLVDPDQRRGGGLGAEPGGVPGRRRRRPRPVTASSDVAASRSAPAMASADGPVTQPDVVVDDLGEAAGAGRDHRPAVRQRLGRGAAEGLVPDRRHHDRRAATRCGPMSDGVDLTHPADPGVRGCRRLDVARQVAVAHDAQLGVHVGPAPGVEQQVDALVGRQAPEEHERALLGCRGRGVAGAGHAVELRPHP